MKKILNILFWIIAFALFPIAAGLYFILPKSIRKSQMPNGWKKFWWIAYILLTIYLICSKVFCVGCLLMMIYCFGGEPIISRENVPISDYQTSEDFYKLTGVEFPDLEMVDSLVYDENIIRANVWNEYKFVAKKGLNENFYKQLNRVCETDSTHWQYNEEEDIYSYWIYPDWHPVDRSRGMCDRMVTMQDGSVTVDWDGDFISVEVQRDTITLRNGWIR